MLRRTHSDASLISRSLDSPEVFGEIFDRHSDAIAGYFAKRVGPAQVSDLLSEVFVTAFKTRNRFENANSSALPWLYGIAHHKLLHYYMSFGRASRANERYQSQADLHDSGRHKGLQEIVVDDIDNQELLGDVLEFIDQQSEIDKEVLLLHVWEGQSYQQLSEILNIPVGTVKSRLNRIRRKIREHFETSGKVLSEATTRPLLADLQGSSEV